MPKDVKATEEFTVDAQKLRSELDRIHAKKKRSGESSSSLGQQRKQAADVRGFAAETEAGGMNKDLGA